MDEWLVALLVGLVQGLLEWLPVSSEGAVALLLAVLGEPVATATRYALFLHAGTAVAAATYYRGELAELFATLPTWRPRRAFGTDTADLTFFGVATIVSAVVGLAGYALLLEVAAATTGGAFVAAIGVLLVGTGVFMRIADSRAVGHRESPAPVDAVLVGVLQGLAVLPGVSRSGTTVAALLLRGHEGPAALRLSFVLSIPAALGAGVLVVLDGVPTVSAGPAVLALGVSAVVGFLAVDVLVRVVRRVAFWRVCVGFGLLAVVGGGLLLI